jgi:hypothetical protein
MCILGKSSYALFVKFKLGSHRSLIMTVNKTHRMMATVAWSLSVAQLKSRYYLFILHRNIRLFDCKFRSCPALSSRGCMS